FSDLDVMAVGPVSAQVSEDFDRYWASRSSYPLARLVEPAAAAEVEDFSAAVRAIQAAPHARSYIDAIRQSSFTSRLTEGTLPLEWAPVRMVSDDPAKALGLARPEEMLLARL